MYSTIISSLPITSIENNIYLSPMLSFVVVVVVVVVVVAVTVVVVVVVVVAVAVVVVDYVVSSSPSPSSPSFDCRYQRLCGSKSMPERRKLY